MYQIKALLLLIRRLKFPTRPTHYFLRRDLVSHWTSKLQEWPESEKIAFFLPKTKNTKSQIIVVDGSMSFSRIHPTAASQRTRREALNRKICCEFSFCADTFSPFFLACDERISNEWTRRFRCVSPSSTLTSFGFQLRANIQHFFFPLKISCSDPKKLQHPHQTE